MIGQNLDLITAPVDRVNFSAYTIDRYNAIVKYKTAYYSFYLPVACAMYMVTWKSFYFYSSVAMTLVEGFVLKGFVRLTLNAVLYFCILRSGFSIANQIKLDLRFTDLWSTWCSEVPFFMHIWWLIKLISDQLWDLIWDHLDNRFSIAN